MFSGYNEKPWQSSAWVLHRGMANGMVWKQAAVGCIIPHLASMSALLLLLSVA